MIPDIAWDNIHWLKTAFFDRLDQYGGMQIAVNSFRPYFKRGWVQRVKPERVRRNLFESVDRWSASIKTTPLLIDFRLPHWTDSIKVARGGADYSKDIWFLYRTHYNLYCLATYRRTIEELVVSAYEYCSLYPINTTIDKSKTEEIVRRRQLLTDRERVFSDFRRLLRLSKAFLVADWAQDMIIQATANDDGEFFHVLSKAVTKNILANATEPAREWLLVILLWFLGGKDYPTRRQFLHELHQHNILSRGVTEEALNAGLGKLGLTRT